MQQISLSILIIFLSILSSSLVQAAIANDACANTTPIPLGLICKATITNPNGIVNSFEDQLTPALANDNVCDATLLTLGQSSPGSFIDATVQENEPFALGGDCQVNWCDSILHGSIWYKFIAPTNAAVNIEISSPTEHSDTKIALYAGIDCTLNNPFQNAVLLDANDDKPGKCCDGSIIALACLNPGETYYIQVDQYHTGQDDFNITVKELASCEFSCDLEIGEINTKRDSCDREEGSITATISSPSGQLFFSELLDEVGNPIDTSENSGFYFHLTEGSYRIRLTSLEAENCIIESELIEIIDICSEGCSPNLAIDLIEKELYHAQQTIISTATLSAEQTTTFKAGTSITLNPGFHAAGIFSASIEECTTNTFVEEIQAEARTTPNSNNLVVFDEVAMKIFPNPFNYSATITYQLPIAGDVTLQVFDFMGKQIAVLEQSTFKEPGQYQVDFQATQLTNGTYFVVLQSGAYYEVQKLMLLKD